MKKTARIIAAVMGIILLFTLVSCGKEEQKPMWDYATYTEDTTLGLGPVTVKVEVAAEDKTVTFTVHTKEATVGAALLENDLIAGDESEYGLYVKKVNGMTADYDVDQSYWAFYIDGETATTGVDGAEINEESVYRLEYTK